MVDFVVPTRRYLACLFMQHVGDPLQQGWRIRLRRKFGYFTPEEWYQGYVDRLVTDNCRWVDVGGGKSVFPENRALSLELAERCSHLAAVDPSNNVDHNDVVHERSRTTIERYQSDELFDLATLRMVAEHVTDPEAVVQSLAQLIKKSGHVVVYTPNRWSVLSLAASVIPDRWHASLSRWLWPDRKDEDVFPTSYKMNTRKQLREVFEAGGFSEVAFAGLDDCTLLQQTRVSATVEYILWKLARLIRIRYPENNLLAVYLRNEDL